MGSKKITRLEYLKSMNTVVEYINNNLDKKLSVSELAEISSLSQFHFHRIMKGLLWEPIGNYITRTRVETAALLIRYTNLEFQKIAYSVGYDKPSSLNKIFKQYFNISPTEFRANKSYTILEPAIINYNIKLEAPRILEIPDMKVIYINVTGEYGAEYYQKTWDELADFATRNNLFTTETQSFGISYDDPKVTEKEKCRYDACFTIHQTVKAQGEIGVKKINGGKFAVFIYKGTYDNWGEIYDIIYDKWLINSEYCLRNVPVMEKYLNSPNLMETSELEIEIYLPIN